MCLVCLNSCYLSLFPLLCQTHEHFFFWVISMMGCTQIFLKGGWAHQSSLLFQRARNSNNNSERSSFPKLCNIQTIRRSGKCPCLDPPLLHAVNMLTGVCIFIGLRSKWFFLVSDANLSCDVGKKKCWYLYSTIS